MEPTKVKGVDSARRVLQILLSFIETSPSVTVDEIADKFQISKPSAYRYISVLRELYFIEEKKRGEFVLTSQMFRLAEVAEQSIDVAAVSRPVLDRLMRETGETVLVLKRSRDSAICIASSVPNVPATISFTPGHHMPLHRGAGPKLLLACSSMDFRERYLTELERRSQSNFEALKHELDIIARTKISQSAAEVDEGIFAVAAPIYNGGRVIAVLSIAGLDFRLADSDRVRVKELVKVGAVEVSESLAEAIE